MEKYVDLGARYIFEPVAVETLGVFNASARHLLNNLARRVSLNSGKTRETSFLYQRISILVQRFNALQCCPFAWQFAGHWHGLKIVPTFLISRLIFVTRPPVLVQIWMFSLCGRPEAERSCLRDDNWLLCWCMQRQRWIMGTGTCCQ